MLRATVGIITVPEYAQAVLDAAARRYLIEVGEDVVTRARLGEPPEQIAARAALAIERLSMGSAASQQSTLDQAIDAALAAMERARNGKTAGISFGFKSFDLRLGGLEPGMVYVLAGRPGMGKSSVGHQIAMNAARAGHGVLELSLEMSATQLGRRTLSTAAGVPIERMKTGKISLAEADRIVCASKELYGLPLTIDDTAGQSPAVIAAKARAARRKHGGLGLVMIDHLHLLRAEDADARHGGTWSVERASATMLQIAKDSECPVLLLAQLNRGVEARDDKRPTLSDLRQSGAIEQDAYAVGFVYRAEYYLRGGIPEKQLGEIDAKFNRRVDEWQQQTAQAHGKAELIWAKVRDGEPGTDILTFDGPTATFGEVSA